MFLSFVHLKVSPESRLTTKLCAKCFIKIISFHEFKTLALKTDAYLRCLENQADYKCDVFEMDNIKCEEMSNNEQSDEYDALCEINHLDNTEHQVKNESDDEFLIVLKKIKDEYKDEACKENSKYATMVKLLLQKCTMLLCGVF